MNYKEEYRRWCEKTSVDIREELKSYTESEIEDSFYCSLAFGTGGLRGIIGAGTNRINVYTIAKASQGLADYVNKQSKRKKIAISYDSRIQSDIFAKVAAEVFAANGIQVYIYPELMPTPCLSYAVRYLSCDAGIMITASHNPSQYNGYKVYGSDGCQITTEVAKEILTEIDKLDIFEDIKSAEFHNCLLQGRIEYIKKEVYDSYIEEIKKQSVLFGEDVDRNIAIVYTPLNGTGLKPVTRVLYEMGYTNIQVVLEQKKADGNFPTCPYPNPEIKETMALGIEYAKKYNADLLLATDPDCDRVGIAVKDRTGNYVLLSGNETGILILDYICSQRIKHGMMPMNPVMVKTIVTTDMGERIASHYGVETINVLTGFKFIGEQIGQMEKQSKEKQYIFGFEESCGYLSGGYVRDKDAVNGASIICEMFSFYATQGISLLDKLEELYKEYGYCLNTLHTYQFEGVKGFAKMQEIMRVFRNSIHSFDCRTVIEKQDYTIGIQGLPRANVLRYLIDDNSSIAIRPSGTEPKLKIYISLFARNKEEAMIQEKKIMEELEKRIHII